MSNLLFDFVISKAEAKINLFCGSLLGGIYEIASLMAGAAGGVGLPFATAVPTGISISLAHYIVVL